MAFYLVDTFYFPIFATWETKETITKTKTNQNIKT